jgi:hypothetical protein
MTKEKLIHETGKDATKLWQPGKEIPVAGWSEVQTPHIQKP